MPEPVYPGVHVEEAGARARRIEALPLPETAFAGVVAQRPPGDAVQRVTNVAGFAALYGAPVADPLARAVEAYFNNGGTALWIAPIDVAGIEAALAGLAAIEGIGTVAAPGLPDHATNAALIAHAEGHRRFAVLGAPQGLSIAEIRAFRAPYDSNRAALYVPWLKTAGSPDPTPPVGAVCGAMARNDIDFGLHKAPANLAIAGAVGLDRVLTAADQDVLNPEGINCIRAFSGRGIRIWGARTLSRDAQWTYITVRRTIEWLTRSIDRGLHWAVFEPNDATLWTAVRGAAETFLHDRWRRGMLLGQTTRDAFYVACGAGATMTAADVAAGRLIVEIGVALIRPAEFITIRIAVQV
jgi:phage tail sheath protein FI